MPDDGVVTGEQPHRREGDDDGQSSADRGLGEQQRAASLRVDAPGEEIGEGDDPDARGKPDAQRDAEEGDVDGQGSVGKQQADPGQPEEQSARGHIHEPHDRTAAEP